MARDKKSVQFTTDHKLLCSEINEIDGAIDGKLPFDSEFVVHGNEFIEDDSVSSIIYDTDKNITAYRFEEDIIIPPEVYILTFEPTVTYSADVGFTITNINTLLQDTNTTLDNWDVGIIRLHNTRGRNSYRRKATQCESARCRRTLWNYDGCANEEYTIDANGVVSNTEMGSRITKSNMNDRYVNNVLTNGSRPCFVGIRLRYRLDDLSNRYKYRSLYSDYFLQCDSNSETLFTKSYAMDYRNH